MTLRDFVNRMRDDLNVYAMRYEEAIRKRGYRETGPFVAWRESFERFLNKRKPPASLSDRPRVQR